MRIDLSRRYYDSYDPNVWTKAGFDPKTGGYNVYHKDHNFSTIGGGGQAEKEVGAILMKLGKQVEFLSEKGHSTRHSDLYFDGQTWDVKYAENANLENIRKKIYGASKQADNAILFVDTNKMEMLRDAVARSNYHKPIGVYYMQIGVVEIICLK